jgi:hypothetical protein
MLQTPFPGFTGAPLCGVLKSRWCIRVGAILNPTLRLAFPVISTISSPQWADHTEGPSTAPPLLRCDSEINWESGTLHIFLPGH